jgi:Male sterility protein.
MNNMPNTYIFTKSMAEHVVKDLCGDIPTVIFRPSIGELTINEHIKSWKTVFLCSVLF